MMLTDFDERFQSSWGQHYLIVDGPNLFFNYLQDYLNTIEGHLGDDATSIQLLYQEFSNDPKRTFNHIQEHRLEMTRTNLENLARGFMFVLAFSLAETELRSVCKNIEHSSPDVLPLKNVRGTDQSIALTETYIRYIGGVNLPELDKWKPWQDLKMYQDLRNRVVHNAGCLNEKDSLRPVIDQHPHLSISTGQGLHGGDLILFHLGFSEEVAKTARDVLMMIEHALRSHYRQMHE